MREESTRGSAIAADETHEHTLTIADLNRECHVKVPFFAQLLEAANFDIDVFSRNHGLRRFVRRVLPCDVDAELWNYLLEADRERWLLAVNLAPGLLQHFVFSFPKGSDPSVSPDVEDISFLPYECPCCLLKQELARSAVHEAPLTVEPSTTQSLLDI